MTKNRTGQSPVAGRALARLGREGGPHISSADRREYDESQRAGLDTADLIGI
ncbi:MAG: hypothetical protein A4E28_03069 [Methanocella sp. PtaU1.Bin125]|nr:MAG: hypothetical protein A4E28_03069 [Methanocella sp. PtaU1.Bin125]